MLASPRCSELARVAIVEDDARLRAAYARVLRDGFDTTTADSAEALLAELDGGRSFDLVLCDLHLPAMSGLALFEHLVARAHPVARRFVLMSGTDVFPRAFSIPMLLKPFDRATLLLAFETLVAVDRPRIH
ncbi:MAG: response regulator [Labilithrix sp.]|nr:response regulator [Labilithrix sp.]